MSQKKDQNKTLEKELNRMEIRNLPVQNTGYKNMQ